MKVTSTAHNWWWNLRFQHWAGPQQLSTVKVNINFYQFDNGDNKLIIQYKYNTKNTDHNSAFCGVRDAIRFPYRGKAKSRQLGESIDLMFDDILAIERVVTQFGEARSDLQNAVVS